MLVLDWLYAPLIFVQTFEGHSTAGHFGLLIIDRTRHADGVFIFVDSFQELGYNTFQKLQGIIRKTPLYRKQSKWIRGNIPQQGTGTNDCGVWMCSMATAYCLTLVKQGVLVPRLAYERPQGSLSKEKLPTKFQATTDYSTNFWSGSPETHAPDPQRKQIPWPILGPRSNRTKS